MRGAAVTLFVLAFVSAPAAEDASPPTARSGSSADGISAARGELELIKAAKDPNQATTRSALPDVKAPELHLGESFEARSRKLKEKELPTKKSDNWLLEAMQEKNTDTARGERGERASRNTEADALMARLLAGRPVNSPDEKPATLVDQMAANDAAREKKSAEPAKPEASAYNPLAQFLGEWMTPQDYSLFGADLKQAAAASELAPIAVGTPTNVSGSTFDSAASGPGLASVLPSVASDRPLAAGAPAQNPFLQGLDLSIASTPALATPPQPSPPAAAPQIFNAPPPERHETPRSAVPDFARPLTDEKYFKPMKRF